MKVVDRHLSGAFVRIFGLATGGFLGLFLVVDFFENIGTILKYDATLPDVVLFFAARLPWMLSQVIPMATLLATLLALVLLARQGEITALRSSGLSLGRLSLPFLVCGLGACLLHGFVQEALAPRGFAFGREVKQVRIKKRSPATLHGAEDLWVRAGDRFLHIGRVRPPGDHLEEVSVAEVREGRVVRRLDAREARWRHGRWELQGVEERRFGEPGAFDATRHAELDYPLSASLEDFDLAERKPEETSWADLRRRIGRHRDQGLETRDLEVNLWAKTSLPFVSVVMPLLALPLAIRTGRRGGAPLAMLLALGLGFTYWIALAFGISLGRAGALPPPLAAWAGNLLFAGIGLHLLRRSDRSI